MKTILHSADRIDSARRHLRYIHTVRLTLALVGLALIAGWTQIRAASSIALEFPIVAQYTNHLRTNAPQSVPSIQAPNPNSTGSGIVYWPARDSYLLLDNGPRRLLEFTLGHQYVRTITLDGFL